ncbi:MAG: A24 family peptidase [Planctomycetaceae bacterium]|jgi:prepilin signal peptidase PulO-like enzyme (type II secretory pathway)|nr:A24 family peptidase [Planctomycetaceae bacterium]
MFIYIICFLIGSVLGLLTNEFVDRWGCSQRYRSTLPKKLFIAFICGIGAAWLYWWEVDMEMLLRYGLSPTAINTSSERIGIDLFGFLLGLYIVHLILFTFLLAATLTDFYEMMIPDSITITGTAVALYIALGSLGLSLPATELRWTVDSIFPIIANRPVAMHVWSPNPAETCSQITLLIIITLLWWFGCFAILDRVWYTKLPFRKANAIFWRYLYRSPRTKHIVSFALWVPLFLAVIFLLPRRGIGNDLAAAGGITLLSALVGMAVGMILVWSIRLVAQWVLGVEAMGFGDVTLMGMIGAFLGWQAVLLVFFMAPFFGLVYGIINLLLGRGRAVPYGPFLCLAAVVVVVAWSPIWSVTTEYFAFGIEIIGIVLFGLLFLFAGLLYIVHKMMKKSE